MIVSGAFLAESAATVDNKLNVEGGVLSKYTVGPDRSARLVLVVLTQPDTDSSNRRVELAIRPPNFDEPIRREFEVPEASLGRFPGFAFFDVDVNLPCDGRWVFEITGEAGWIALPLVVDTWIPPTPPTPPTPTATPSTAPDA